MSATDYIGIMVILLFIYYNKRLWNMVLYWFDKITTWIETGEFK